MASKAYPQVVRDTLDKLTQERNRVLQVIEVANMAEIVVKEFEHLKPDLSISGWLDKSVIVKIKPTKMAEVGEFLRVLAKRGYRIEKVDENPGWGNITYRMKDNRLRVEVDFEMQDGENKDATRMCRYVKVGETREVKEIVTPIYELHCDNE